MVKTFYDCRIGIGPGYIYEQEINLDDFEELADVIEWLRTHRLDYEHGGYIYEMQFDDIYGHCDDFKGDWKFDPEEVFTAIYKSGILEDSEKHDLFLAMAEIEGLEWVMKELIKDPERWSEGVYYFGNVSLMELCEDDYNEDEETRKLIDNEYGGEVGEYAYYLQFDGYKESASHGTYLYNR